jgi:hypothetical protein
VKKENRLGERLHQDGSGELAAEADLRVVYPADAGGSGLEALDDRILAEAHLAQAIADVRLRIQLTDADGGTGSN